MKQYTSNEQTAKLIELGFGKPSNTIVKEEPIYREGTIIDWKPIGEEGAYSIGELIEMLPTHYKTVNKWFELAIAYSVINSGWIVGGHRNPKDNTDGDELIDALFDMVVKLKKEEVI